MLGEWTFEEGDDFDQTRDLYNQVFNQFRRYVGHVTANIGGVIEISKTHDQNEAVYNHVSKTQQKRAMDFLKTNLFTTPSWLFNESLARKIEPNGLVDRISNLQSNALNILFNKSRLNRMSENVSLNGNAAYSVFELFEDTRQSIFSTGRGNDVYGRNLQRLYVEKMEEIIKMKDRDAEVSDMKAAARATLFSIEQSLKPKKKFSTMEQMLSLIHI